MATAQQSMPVSGKRLGCCLIRNHIQLCQMWISSQIFSSFYSFFFYFFFFSPLSCLFKPEGLHIWWWYNGRTNRDQGIFFLLLFKCVFMCTNNSFRHMVVHHVNILISRAQLFWQFENERSDQTIILYLCWRNEIRLVLKRVFPLSTKAYRISSYLH